MKKVLALMLALVFVLSLVACGGSSGGEKSMTKEEMIESAKLATIGSITSDFNDNVAKAKNTYFNNVYTIWGYITDIGEDYVDLRPNNSTSSDCIRAYLPNDELIELDKWYAIQVVGIVSGLAEDSSNVAEYTFDYNIILLENAHFVTDIYRLNDMDITEITYDRSTYKYLCEVRDGNFGKIFLNCSSSQVSSEQWGNYQNYRMSATGKVKMDLEYGSLSCGSGIMDSSDVSLSKK